MSAKKIVAESLSEAMRQAKIIMGIDALVLSSRTVENQTEIIVISREELDAITHSKMAKHNQPELPFVWRPRNTKYQKIINDVVVSSQDIEPINMDPTIPKRDELEIQETTPKNDNDTTSPSKKTTEDIDLAHQRLLSEFSEIKSLLREHLPELAWEKVKVSFNKHDALVKQLLDYGFSAPLTAEIVASLPPAEANEETTKQLILKFLDGRLSHIDPFELFKAGGIFALIGPTGVGKTTALAKIAARSILMLGRENVEILTTDTFKIGAQDQLRRFAKIMGVQVTAISSPDELSIKLNSPTKKVLTLIDTAGASARDAHMLEQSSVLHEAGAQIKRILVLSSSTELRTQEDIITQHENLSIKDQSAGILGAIITKTDESAYIAPIVDCLIRHGLPTIYISNGQRVPEDLHGGLNTIKYLSHKSINPKQNHEHLALMDDFLHLVKND